MRGSAASPSSCSGGREASTGWFTRSSWCFVGCICFLVCCTGDGLQPLIRLFAAHICDYDWFSVIGEVFFSSQIYAHAKAAGSLRARCPLLWPVHQRQLHPSSVCTGWVSLGLAPSLSSVTIIHFWFCPRFLRNHGFQPLVGSVHQLPTAW